MSPAGAYIWGYCLGVAAASAIIYVALAGHPILGYMVALGVYFAGAFAITRKRKEVNE